MSLTAAPFEMPASLASDFKTESPAASAATYQTQTKSRVVYILLAVFLGFMGTHNFYAERYKIAVRQCLITAFTFWLIAPAIIIWLWALYEVWDVKTDAQGTAFHVWPRVKVPALFKAI